MKTNNVLGICVFLILIIIVVAFGTIMLMRVGYIEEINDLEDDIAELKTDLDICGISKKSLSDSMTYHKNQADYWKDKYNNNPITVYDNNTMYVTDTVYVNNTEYVFLTNTHCDVTGDGIVDYNDVCKVLWYVNDGLKVVEELFYSKYPNGWDILYDTNRDGKINLRDVEVVLANCDVV